MGHDITLAASDNFQLGGYRADPATPPRAAVVVIQEVFGVNHHIRAVCDRLAGEGANALSRGIEPGNPFRGFPMTRYAMAHRQFTRRRGVSRNDGALNQNQRSPTSTVSPGPSGVPSGTTARLKPAWSVWVSVTLSRRARGEKPPAIATALSTLILGT